MEHRQIFWLFFDYFLFYFVFHQLPHEKEGFPTSSKTPLPFNLFESNSYAHLNELDLPTQSFENKYYNTVDTQYKSRLRDIATCTYLVYMDDIPVSTAVHATPNKFLLAKHCIDTATESSQIQLVASYLKLEDKCCFYSVSKIIFHHDEDAALLIAEGNLFNDLGKVAQCSFVEQHAGGYFILHHAGGLPLQVSSGLIPSMDQYQFQHLLLVDAGPLASGAGIFDAHTLQLIGINTARVLEWNNISRRILKLHTLEKWLLKHIIENKEEDLIESTTEIRSKKVTAQPVPYLIPTGYENLYSSQLEIVTWLRASRQAQAIQRFLNELSQYLSHTIQRNDITLPHFLSTIPEFAGLDSHQSQHLGTRSNKTRIRETIGSSVENPLIKILGAVITSVCHLFNCRIPASDKNNTQLNLLICQSIHNEWAIDLSPVVIGFDNQTPCTIARVDGNPLGAFHYYPIHYSDDDIVKKKVNVIDVANLLTHIINVETNLQRDHTFYNQAHPYRA